MGIFDNIKNPFAKKDDKDEPQKESSASTTPSLSTPRIDPVVDWILQKRETGTPDDEIKRLLLAHKHSPADIEKAMAEADALSGPEPLPIPDFPGPSDFKPLPKDLDGVETYERSQSMAEIENLIDDRIKKVRGDLDKMIQWKSDTEDKLDKLSTQLDQLVEMVTQQRNREREKFEEYDKHLSEVKVELKASQDVFKKGLPEFTRAVQELSRMSKGSGAARPAASRNRLEDSV